MTLQQKLQRFLFRSKLDSDTTESFGYLLEKKTETNRETNCKIVTLILGSLPSRQQTHSTLGKGKSSTQKCLGIGYVNFQEGIYCIQRESLAKLPPLTPNWGAPKSQGGPHKFEEAVIKQLREISWQGLILLPCLEVYVTRRPVDF